MIPFETPAPSAAGSQARQFAVLSAEGRLLFTNSAWETFGREISSAIRPVTAGVNYLERLNASDESAATQIAEAIERCVDGRDRTVQTAYSYATADSTYRFQLWACPFTLEDDRYVAVTHRAVTNAPDEQYRRFKQAIEAAGHAVFITNVDGEITYVNPAFEQITGYDASEAIGQTPGLLSSGEMSESYFSRLWETILDGEVWEELIVNRRKSGELYYAHQTIAPVVNDAGEPVEFVGLQTDTTELRTSRHGIEKLGQILRHDLRNELSVAQSYAELIEQQDDGSTEHATKIVETISSLLETSEKGIELQRFLSRTHRPKPTDIAGVVDTVVSKAPERYPTAAFTDSTPEAVTGLCLAELEIALMELVENAIVHNDSETPQVEFRVELTEGWVEIHIADNGPGLPEMEQETLDTGGSDLYHDTGFGLNLAYWIIRRSGGNLQFEEREQRGTIITIRLPHVDR